MDVSIKVKDSVTGFNFGGRGNKIATVSLSLNLSTVFDLCLYLQRSCSSGCAAGRALEGAPYRPSPQTTATKGPTAAHPSCHLPRGLRQKWGEGNSTESGYGQKALGAQRREGTGESLRSSSWDSPISQLGRQRELVRAWAGLLLLHCGEVKHQLKIHFFISNRHTWSIILEVRPFVQS